MNTKSKYREKERDRRPYKDPTANAAIAHVMREEARKRRLEKKRKRESSGRDSRNSYTPNGRSGGERNEQVK